MSRLADLIRLYELLDQLALRTGGTRSIDKLSDHRDWPSRGVYFFLGPSESRDNSGTGLRVVRVGTHALTNGSKSTLRQRLGQHRGNVSGGGNHRGSIFRLLVGQALLARGGLPACTSWGIKNDKRKAALALELELDHDTLDEAEFPAELAVSEYLGTMPFLWLKVEDEPAPNSLRGLVERNTIALLSNHGRTAIDPPSAEWLGRNSDRNMVRESGLWNQQHVTETHDPQYLNILKTLISKTGNNH